MIQILNISNAQLLTKEEQKAIHGGNRGGVVRCNSDADCSFACGKCNRRNLCMFPANGCA